MTKFTIAAALAGVIFLVNNGAFAETNKDQGLTVENASKMFDTSGFNKSKKMGIVEKVGDKFFFTDDKGERFEFKKYDEQERRGTYVDKEGNTFAVDPNGKKHRVYR